MPWTWMLTLRVAGCSDWQMPGRATPSNIRRLVPGVGDVRIVEQVGELDADGVALVNTQSQRSRALVVA